MRSTTPASIEAVRLEKAMLKGALSPVHDMDGSSISPRAGASTILPRKWKSIKSRSKTTR